MFEVRLTPEALNDLRTYSKHDRARILDQIDACLRYEPGRETINNKVLRPNRLAERELRVGRFRVFYDVDDERSAVRIVAIGHKHGNHLYVGGQEFQL